MERIRKSVRLLLDGQQLCDVAKTMGVTPTTAKGWSRDHRPTWLRVLSEEMQNTGVDQSELHMRSAMLGRWQSKGQPIPSWSWEEFRTRYAPVGTRIGEQRTKAALRMIEEILSPRSLDELTEARLGDFQRALRSRGLKFVPLT